MGLAESKRLQMNTPRLDGAFELTVSHWMANDLEDYLPSEVLYWQISLANPLGNRMPQLTIGGLLEALLRAQAAIDELSAAQRSDLQAARLKHDQIRNKYTANYLVKATREINSRLDAWSSYLDEATRKPGDVAIYYPQEVRARAKAYLLAQALGHNLPATAEQRLTALDSQLHSVFQPGTFVWDTRLQAAFPADRCWWLYGTLPE